MGKKLNEDEKFKKLLLSIEEKYPFEELELFYEINPEPYARPRKSKKLEKAGFKNPFYNPKDKYKKKLIKMVELDIKESLKDFKIINGEVELNIEFGLIPPKFLTESKTKWKLVLERIFKPIVRPDIDNYIKPILDVLNKRIYLDDGQIATLIAKKVYTKEPDKPYISIKLRYRQEKIKLR